MATRSRVGLMLEDGTIKHSYCHYDGYPEGVGYTLIQNYSDIDKVKELLSFGDMSFLASKVIPEGEHSFNNPEQNVTVFYGRDRGETEIQAKHSTMDEFLDDQCIPYFYLFEGKNWWVKSIYSDYTEWKLVKEFLSTYILTKEDYACNIEM